MKKFFNDHLGLCLVLAVAVGGVALYFSLKNDKEIKKLAYAISAAAAATGAATPTDGGQA